VDAGYRIANGPPSVEDYLMLRELAGLTPRSREQAEGAIDGAWAAVHVVETTEDTCVGMGRVLGDGGWCFHITDMAVLPAHQRHGLGSAILRELLACIKSAAPPGALVSLLADSPGQELYRKHGFVPTAPASIGMATIL
jgi:GNAT superfamily N-acetyltransferase